MTDEQHAGQHAYADVQKPRDDGVTPTITKLRLKDGGLSLGDSQRLDLQ